LWEGKIKWLYQPILAFASVQINRRTKLKEMLPIPSIHSGGEIGNRIIVTLTGPILNEYKGNMYILEELSIEHLVQMNGTVGIISRP
jgi:hypothetical protein